MTIIYRCHNNVTCIKRDGQHPFLYTKGDKVGDEMSGGRLLRSYRRHRVKRKEEKEIIERRLEKYTTRPLPKKKEEDEEK